MLSSNIKEFEQGESLVSPGFREKLNILVRACRSNIINNVVGGLVRRNDGGTTIEILESTQDSETASSSTHPFKISMRGKSGSPGEYEAYVELESDLMRSLHPTDKLPITGLGTWFPLIANDVIWVQITTNGTTATAASVDSYGQDDSNFVPTHTFDCGNISGDNGTGYIGFTSGGSNTQKDAKIMLGYSVPDDNGNPSLVQTWTTHILLSQICVCGRICIYDATSPRGHYTYELR